MLVLHEPLHFHSSIRRSRLPDIVKILYDYQAFSRQFYGGVSRYFVEVAKRLSHAEGTQLRVCAPLYINHYLKELDPQLVAGRPVVNLPKAIGKVLNVYNRPATRRYVASFLPDILHETYFSRKSVRLNPSQARVVTVYDMIHELYPEYFPAWDKSSVNKRLAVRRADHVICISENTKRDLLDIFELPQEKVSVVHLGFDPQKVSDSTSESLVDGPYLLYVGIRSGYKNFSRLLEAYATTKALRDSYRLVCFGGGDFSKSEISRVRELKLDEDRLLWKGGDDSILMRLYAHASAFVYPSLYEGFGIPPLEAMAHDCPVVCSSGGSVSEVVGDAGEFFEPRDCDSIAHAIEAVVGSHKRVEELGKAGRARVASFSWDKCAERTMDVYSLVT
jgi:glycosyltransferase involved in cell wall biosynthesis